MEEASYEALGSCVEDPYSLPFGDPYDDPFGDTYDLGSGFAADLVVEVCEIDVDAAVPEDETPLPAVAAPDVEEFDEAVAELDPEVADVCDTEVDAAVAADEAPVLPVIEPDVEELPEAIAELDGEKYIEEEARSVSPCTERGAPSDDDDVVMVDEGGPAPRSPSSEESDGSEPRWLRRDEAGDAAAAMDAEMTASFLDGLNEDVDDDRSAMAQVCPHLATYLIGHPEAHVTNKRKRQQGKRYFADVRSEDVMADKVVTGCWACGKLDHESQDCVFKRCFVCSGQGHEQSECGNRRLWCQLCRRQGHTAKECPDSDYMDGLGVLLKEDVEATFIRCVVCETECTATTGHGLANCGSLARGRAVPAGAWLRRPAPPQEPPGPPPVLRPFPSVPRPSAVPIGGGWGWRGSSKPAPPPGSPPEDVCAEPTPSGRSWHGSSPYGTSAQPTSWHSRRGSWQPAPPPGSPPTSAWAQPTPTGAGAKWRSPAPPPGSPPEPPSSPPPAATSKAPQPWQGPGRPNSGGWGRGWAAAPKKASSTAVAGSGGGGYWDGADGCGGVDWNEPWQKRRGGRRKR